MKKYLISSSTKSNSGSSARCEHMVLTYLPKITQIVCQIQTLTSTVFLKKYSPYSRTYPHLTEPPLLITMLCCVDMGKLLSAAQGYQGLSANLAMNTDIVTKGEVSPSNKHFLSASPKYQYIANVPEPLMQDCRQLSKTNVKRKAN